MNSKRLLPSFAHETFDLMGAVRFLVDAVSLPDCLICWHHYFINSATTSEKMDAIKLKDGATQWIDSWNKRDLEKIMEHYADDIELYSPIVTSRWNIPEGIIRGKEKLREHLSKAFEATPGTNRKLLDMLLGVNSLILVYQDEKGTISADLVEFNDAGKVKVVKAYYTASSPDTITKS